MRSLEFILDRRRTILEIAGRHGARNVRIFGSVVRGQETVQSDVDFLVTMDQGRSLIDHAALMQELEEILGCRVDVVSERALHRHIRDRVLGEAIPL